jgi:hypothetical protein
MKLKLKAVAAGIRAIDNRATTDVRKLHSEAAELHRRAEKALKETRPKASQAHHVMYMYHRDVAACNGDPSRFGPNTIPACYGALYAL